jgi:hypothetical protein
MRLDLARLKADMHRQEEQIRALKREIRTTPQPWEREMWSELFSLKADVTLLYAIRAQVRGRLHLTKVIRRHAPLGLPPMERFTLEDQARLIGDRWKPYELPGELPWAG